VSAAPPRANNASVRPSEWTLAVKRVVDVIGSALGLLVLWPLFLGIAIAIKSDSFGPAFFRQERIGKGGQPFRIFKFRSMIAAAPQTGNAITVRDDRRITRVGAFLRRKKLDELPQLINVLLGDMSLVGPRPEVHEFMKLYTPQQRTLIISLRPGMTDYAAILFRDESSLLDGRDDPVKIYQREIMPIKFSYYERYSRDVGLVNDIRIIAATVSLLAFGHVPKALGIEHELPRTTLA
jgi:lipopolysaccharide/colanic/teichoic acid biosynthesis glycosyltransferase